MSSKVKITTFLGPAIKTNAAVRLTLYAEEAFN
jgi:hypothetical protein